MALRLRQTPDLYDEYDKVDGTPRHSQCVVRHLRNARGFMGEVRQLRQKMFDFGDITDNNYDYDDEDLDDDAGFNVGEEQPFEDIYTATLVGSQACSTPLQSRRAVAGQGAFWCLASSHGRRVPLIDSTARTCCCSRPSSRQPLPLGLTSPRFTPLDKSYTSLPQWPP
jgi:hypothetical protein